MSVIHRGHAGHRPNRMWFRKRMRDRRLNWDGAMVLTPEGWQEIRAALIRNRHVLEKIANG